MPFKLHGSIASQPAALSAAHPLYLDQKAGSTFHHSMKVLQFRRGMASYAALCSRGSA